MNRSVNTCRISRVMVVLPGLLIAAVLGLGLAGPLLAGQAPKVLPRKSLPYGRTYGEWSASWWQWALSQPLTGHPFNDDPAFDFASGQSGSVWFMSGAYGTVSRNVTLPSGKALFIGMIDAEASDLEGLGSTEAERRASAEFFGDHIVTSTLSCTIDGSSVANITAYRASSPEFGFTAPSPWIFGATGGQGLAVADGYYLMLAPPSAGAHTIHFTGSFHFAIADGDPFDLDLAFDDTYNVTVQ